MPYDDPSLKEFDNYYQARSASKRERAENWAVAIGLQKVDGLTPSRYLIDVAKRHIEGDISGAAATRMIDKYYETKAGHDVPEDVSDEEKAALGKGGKATSKKRSGKSGQKKVVRKAAAEKSGQKTVDRILVMLRQHPESTQQSLGQELGINRSAIQRHLSNLKSAGKLRRVGPDKGGHWEVIG